MPQTQEPDAPVPLDGYAERLWAHYQKPQGRPWPADRMPMRRYEWQQLIHRLDLSIEVKAVANALALLGNADGSRVAPADPRVRDGLGIGERQMRAHVAVLRRYKLLHTVRPGGGRGHTEGIALCQLTMPTDGIALPYRLDGDFTALTARAKAPAPVKALAASAAARNSGSNATDLTDGIPGSGAAGDSDGNPGSETADVSAKPRQPTAETPAVQRPNSGSGAADTVVTSEKATPRVVSLGDHPTSPATPQPPADLSLAARTAAAQAVLDDLGEAATEFLIGAAQHELRAEGHTPTSRLLIIRAAEIATRPNPAAVDAAGTPTDSRQES